MPQVKDIGTNETPPRDTDWVLVKPTINGKFAVQKSNSDCANATSYRIPAFDTEIAALSASLAWAKMHGVTVVYVKSRHS